MIEDAPEKGFQREIADLLQRKREIDAKRKSFGLGLSTYDGWMAEALELLLMIASVEDDAEFRRRLSDMHRILEAIARGLGVEA
jgi:hypothetical protein